jgi:hypothetical protein
MQDFSTEFFILWEVLAGNYLVSKSLKIGSILFPSNQDIVDLPPDF